MVSKGLNGKSRGFANREPLGQSVTNQQKGPLSKLLYLTQLSPSSVTTARFPLYWRVHDMFQLKWAGIGRAEIYPPSELTVLWSTPPSHPPNRIFQAHLCRPLFNQSFRPPARPPPPNRDQDC